MRNMATALADPSMPFQEYGWNLRTVRPDRPVGSAFAYANANYNVLGLIVEAVAGQNYASYV